MSRSDLRMLRERPETRLGFTVRRSEIVDQILIPKFYDPQLERDLVREERADERPWMTLGNLESSGALSAVTGVEVGKMAYGTGAIPFLRTSDIAEWEVSRDSKQSVSEEVFRAYEAKAALEENDVLLVRDGTYLLVLLRLCRTMTLLLSSVAVCSVSEYMTETWVAPPRSPCTVEPSNRSASNASAAVHPRRYRYARAPTASGATALPFAEILRGLGSPG